MQLTAKDIAGLVNGEVLGNGDVTITGLATLKEAKPTDLAFFNHPKYVKDFNDSKAAAVLIKKGSNLNNRTTIQVEDPQIAFTKILSLLEKEKSSPPTGIHPTAVIASDVTLGDQVSVGPHTVIESGVKIGNNTLISAQCYIGKNSSLGENCKIYPQVTLREETTIGHRVIIHSGTVIGSDGFGYAFSQGTHQKIPQMGSVEIENDVEIGSNVSVDRATVGKTRIGAGSKIDNLVQIAHNVQIGRGCILVSQAGVAGSSRLGNFVTLAGQVGVVGHVTIGDQVIAAAQSGIPNDVEAKAIVFGSPARPIHTERKIQTIIGKLPKIYDEFRKIKKLLNFEKKQESK